MEVFKPIILTNDFGFGSALAQKSRQYDLLMSFVEAACNQRMRLNESQVKLPVQLGQQWQVTFGPVSASASSAASGLNEESPSALPVLDFMSAVARIKGFSRVHAVQKHNETMLMPGTYRTQERLLPVIATGKTSRKSLCWTEDNILQQLQQHTNIVRLFANVRENNLIVLVEEQLFVPVLCTDYPLPPVMVAKMFLDIYAALVHAHSRHICHRDVKTSNIMVRYDRTLWAKPQKKHKSGPRNSIPVHGDKVTFVLTDWDAAWQQPVPLTLTLRNASAEIYCPALQQGKPHTHEADLYGLGKALRLFYSHVDQQGAVQLRAQLSEIICELEQLNGDGNTIATQSNLDKYVARIGSLYDDGALRAATFYIEHPIDLDVSFADDADDADDESARSHTIKNVEMATSPNPDIDKFYEGTM